MKLFLNTLLYGDSKTKRLLWFMVICSVLAVASVIGAVSFKQSSLFGLTLILIVAVVITSQLYDFSELQECEELDDDVAVKPEDILVRYTEKRLKQVFIKFHVRPDHRPIIIDCSEKYKIKESPAYVWVFRGRFHILLIEKNAREITLPVTEVGPVRYRRAVPIAMKGEYVQFHKPSLLTNVFSDYLPTPYEYGQGTIKRRLKNLYVIGEDIAITGRSARQIFELTGAGFQIKDKLTESGDYSEDFIEMYKSYTLFRDHVLDANQYKERVTKILDDMAVSNMLDAELTVNLEKMKNFHFITTDYVNYCLEKRIKIINARKKSK